MTAGLLQALVPLFFVLALGYLAGRHHAFDKDQAAGFNTLLVDYALPAMLFTGVIGIDRDTLVGDAPLLATFAITYAAGFAAFVAAARYGARLPAAESAILGLVAMSPAAPFFGPSVLGPLYPNGGAGSIALAALAINAVQVPLALLVIGAGRGGGSIPALLGRTLSTPMVLAPLAGAALVLAGVRLPEWGVTAVRLIGSATSGVAVFSAGLTLAANELHLSRAVLLSSAAKLVVVPVLTLLLGRALGVSGSTLAEAVVLSALSAGMIGLILASRFCAAVEEAGSIVLLTAIGMAVTLPAWILLLQCVT